MRIAGEELALGTSSKSGTTALKLLLKTGIAERMEELAKVQEPTITCAEAIQMSLRVFCVAAVQNRPMRKVQVAPIWRGER